MNKVIKICVGISIFFCSALSLLAQSALTELPFGVVIGKTTNEEIENRGVCVNQIMVSDTEVRCEAYDIAGNFIVLSSQNEVVNKLVFDASKGNQLPRQWQELGLAFGSQNNPGTLEIDFRNIIKANGADYINTSIIFEGTEEIGTLFKFEIGTLNYEAEIITNSVKGKQLGLSSIKITEAY